MENVKVYVIARQGNGRDFFEDLAIISINERFYIFHFNDVLSIDDIGMSSQRNGQLVQLNPIGAENMVIEAVKSFNKSNATNFNDYCKGYLDKTGLRNFSFIKGRQVYA